MARVLKDTSIVKNFGSVFNLENFFNGDGIEAGIIVVHRIFQVSINGFRHIKNKLGKLLVAGEADRNTGIQLFKEAHSGSDHVLVVLGAVKDTVHEKALVLELTGQDFEGHGQHGAVGIGLGAFDLHAFQLHFILASGDGGEITAAVLLGNLPVPNGAYPGEGPSDQQNDQSCQNQ